MGIRRSVSRTGPDTFAVALEENERRVLRVLVSELRQLLVDGSDPSLQRLFPPTYPDDAERQAELAALAHDELLESRLAGIDVVEQTLEDQQLDEEQLGDWMRTVNQLRLVLGTQLDVTEDEGPEVEPDDPDRARKELYHYLGWLLDDLVTALSP